MNPRMTLAALTFALVSLPAAAEAQTLASNDAPSTSSTLLPAAVTLTRPGVHAAYSDVLVDGLEVVDTVRADVDGDGDQDVLALIDISADADEDKPDLGRGVAILYREHHGWRGETVASVGRWPVEAGFNWGEVDRLRAGTTPLLHVLYSQAAPGGEPLQIDTIVRFDHGVITPVFASHAGGRAQRVSVRASDVDGDGTNELLERVATEAHCDRTACVPASETRRVFRWDAATGRFVERDGRGPIAARETRRVRADTVLAARSTR